MFKDTKYGGNTWDVKVEDTGYYLQDALGSTVMVTNNKGHVEGSFSYDAFGSLYDDSLLPWGNNDWEQKGKHSVPLNLYNGKRLDPVVGLYDYGFRDYAPELGRFTTVDPIKSQNNWYAYVGNDPINFVDPLGLTASDNFSSLNNNILEQGIVIQLGLTGTLGAGGSTTLEGGLVLGLSSDSFSIGLYGTVGAGPEFGGNASLIATLTVTPGTSNPDDLSGGAKQVGGSGGDGVSLGGDATFQDNGYKSYSFSAGGGVKFPLPAESHAFITDTGVVSTTINF